MDRAPLMHLLLLLLRYQRLPPFQSHLPTPSLPVVGTTHDAVMIEKARQGMRARKSRPRGCQGSQTPLLPPTPATLTVSRTTSQCGHCQGNWAAPPPRSVGG